MRYAYDKLVVRCLEPREFPPNELRAAVEYLKTLPDAKFTGLMAEVSVSAGKYRLKSQPFLKLDEIRGKNPTDVWEMFDRQVDEQRKGLIRRDLGRDPDNWDDYL